MLLLLLTCVTVSSYSAGRLIHTGSDLRRDEHVEFLPFSFDKFKRQTVPTCINGYENVVNSTMCAVDSPNFVPGSEGVSVADRQIILDAHNKFRAGVKPPAKNMMKVYWDEELAATAEKWAKQCHVGHDPELKMTNHIPQYGETPGQNGAFGYDSWLSAVSGWYDEVKDYKYGEDPDYYLGPGQMIGHYTQVVKDTAILVGCGYAKCTTGYKSFYFCNYLTGQSNFQKPYKNGKSCADCPNSCSGKVCDCGEKFCFNGGTMDINRCGCSCKSPWSGPKCQNHPCNGLTCKNGGTLDVTTCTCGCTGSYSGKSCQTLSCGKMLDPEHCGTQWTKSYCTEYTNVPEECPIMCGRCPEMCNGKKCENGGTLDAKTCSCSCTSVYQGDTCSTPKCPDADDDSCADWPYSDCQDYSNVPELCPYMCGVCQY